jgi:hypothetical protein
VRTFVAHAQGRQDDDGDETKQADHGRKRAISGEVVFGEDGRKRTSPGLYLFPAVTC